MIEVAYMIAPLGALKAAAKILGIPVIKVKRGHYRIDVVKTDKINLGFWLLARQAMYDWIDIHKRTMHGGCETGYRQVKR